MGKGYIKYLADLSEDFNATVLEDGIFRKDFD